MSYLSVRKIEPDIDSIIKNAVDELKTELKSDIDTIKEKKVSVGVITDEHLNKFENRFNDVISALGLSKTLTINQIDIVKDTIMGKVNQKTEELLRLINEKDYSPEIKNEVNINQADVIAAIDLMKTDIVKSLKELRSELSRKKKYEFKVERNGDELITSITAIEK